MQPLLTAVWVVLPALIPNTAALLAGGGTPLDYGRTWRGHRLIGDGVTIRGSGAGIVAGVVTAFLLNAANPFVPFAVPQLPWIAVILLPVGALFGDLVASMFKRQLGVARGRPAPVLDQVDYAFVTVPLLFLALPAWAAATFTAEVLAVVFLVVPLLRFATNIIFHRIGWKNEPW